MASSCYADEVRIVLIGKTGAGKSSLGNTIAGRKIFKPVVGFRSGTQQTGWETFTRDGRRIQVTDTPGVCDTRRKPKDVTKEIAKSLTAATPGPHAILMVLKGSDRFTEEEGKAYDELKDLFRGFENYLIIVFTRIDELEEGDTTLEKLLDNAPPKVGEIIQEAGGRYIGINNKKGGTEEGDRLLTMVDEVIRKNKNGFYTNRLLETITEKVDERAKRKHVQNEVIKKETVEEKDPSFLDKIISILNNFVFRWLCTVL